MNTSSNDPGKFSLVLDLCQRTVRVKGSNRGLLKAALAEACAEYGVVRDISIVSIDIDGRSGFCFVNFETAEGRDAMIRSCGLGQYGGSVLIPFKALEEKNGDGVT